jgi:hypothetical protein
MSAPNDRQGGQPSGPNWSRINQWLLWIGLAAAVVWMFVRHNAHLLQLLPFLILLACPLMHLFGHGGHGGHSGHGRDADEPRPPPPRDPGGHSH